ncbi:MAG TPA: hypothetical protein VEQ58_20190 [Polyangiaceae bacterium]|nr:hypothetical protein [Polyangiaceae bacterium]
MTSRLFHAVVVMGASLGACTANQPPPTPATPPPPTPSTTPPLISAPAPATTNKVVQSPTADEPPKIPADPEPAPPATSNKKNAAGKAPCPPHSEIPYPPCWLIL